MHVIIIFYYAVVYLEKIYCTAANVFIKLILTLYTLHTRADLEIYTAGCGAYC